MNSLVVREIFLQCVITKYVVYHCNLLVANLQKTLSSQAKVWLRLSRFHGPVYSFTIQPPPGTGPVGPVSTGPLFPSPMACLALPNR